MTLPSPTDSVKGEPSASKKALHILFVFFFIMLLSVPLAFNLGMGRVSQQDNRVQAAFPDVPHTLKELYNFPKKLGDYLNDNFGLRRQLVSAHNTIYWYGLHESPLAKIFRGRNGRLFLDEGDERFRDTLSNCGAYPWPEQWLTEQAELIATSVEKISKSVPSVRIFVIPTSTVLYMDDLPPWVASACRGKVPFVEGMISRLPHDVAERFYYPVTAARDLPSDEILIPRNNFHWAGIGPVRLLEEIIDNAHLALRKRTLKEAKVREKSDLSGMLPGIDLTQDYFSPDLGSGEISPCTGDQCFPEKLFENIPVPLETWRFSIKGGTKRLLLLSDSFGYAASPGFSEYFDDIIALSMNNFQHLSDFDKKRLWNMLVTDWRPDDIWILVNDGNITQLPRFVRMLPFE